LRVVLETLEKIAAARGVVTQRKAEQITGKDGGPVQVEHDYKHLSNVELAALLSAGGGDSEAGGASPD
jgi:hypothetical protein